MFRNWLSSYYLRLAVKELKVHLKTAPRVNIVIPTLDGLGLHFVLKALKLYPSKVECISLRITGAERRGIFGFVNSSEIFKSICEKFPDKLHLGFEVKRYETKLLDDGISSKNIFWAPMPHIFRRPKTYLDKELMHESITLGFLGSARPNKGFDDIPKILDSLKANNIIFTALIQLPKFEWPEFRQTYNKLQKNHLNVIKFINSSISKENLDRKISAVDLIVLPYRFHNYQLAGSGILFLAADYKVPVASTNNLAFCWDIERFKIGFTFEDESDFSFKLKYFSKSSLHSNFEHYNDSRNVANLKFLRIARI
jgi:glycosyltransferase involved in cell wall biosynthesis